MYKYLTDSFILNKYLLTIKPATELANTKSGSWAYILCMYFKEIFLPEFSPSSVWFAIFLDPFTSLLIEGASKSSMGTEGWCYQLLRITLSFAICSANLKSLFFLKLPRIISHGIDSLFWFEVGMYIVIKSQSHD